MGDNHDTFKDRSRQLWQRRAGRELSDEDVREITGNISGFFALLAEWARAERLELTTSQPMKRNAERSSSEKHAPACRTKQGRQTKK